MPPKRKGIYPIPFSPENEISGVRSLDLVDITDLKQEAIKRIKFIKEIFLDGSEFDKSPARTQREAYFHQLGKYQELKRFCNITKEDLK